MLVYGDSGIGKTVLGGTCPNSLILGTEPGTISAKRQGSQSELWPIPDWDELVAAYTYLKHEDHGYEWVVLDSVTEMQQKGRRWILDRAVAENDSRDPDIFAIQDWMKWYEMYKSMVKAFCELNVNVLFTALPLRVEQETEDDVEPLVLPMIEGKGFQYAQWTCAQMSVVGYYCIKSIKVRDSEERKEVRRLICQNTPPYFAKDRYGVLGHHIDNPTMAKVAEMIKGPLPLTTAAAPKKAATTVRRAAARRSTTAGGN